MALTTELLNDWCVGKGRECPDLYLRHIEDALEKVKPGFLNNSFGERYWEIVSNRKSFAIQQLSSAVEEAFGASRLLDMVGDKLDPKSYLAGKFIKHAGEEIEHHHLFVRMFELVFPEFSISSTFNDQIASSLPELKLQNQKYKPFDLKEFNSHLVMEIAQINIGELRNLIQLKLSQPVIAAHCRNEEVREEAAAIMDRLISDELGHIYYTAVILQRLLASHFKDEVGSVLKQAIYLFDLEAKEAMWSEKKIASEDRETKIKADLLRLVS